jgi:hypothetical protein
MSLAAQWRALPMSLQFVHETRAEDIALAALIAGARDLVENLRRLATQLGDVPEAWDLAKIAADLELTIFNEEVQ